MSKHGKNGDGTKANGVHKPAGPAMGSSLMSPSEMEASAKATVAAASPLPDPPTASESPMTPEVASAVAQAMKANPAVIHIKLSDAELATVKPAHTIIEQSKVQLADVTLQIAALEAAKAALIAQIQQSNTKGLEALSAIVRARGLDPAVGKYNLQLATGVLTHTPPEQPATPAN